MLENQAEALKTILLNEDLQQYTGDAFLNLIQAVVASDPFAAIAAGRNIKEIVFHMPTILFWDKMKRYLLGTFHNREDQIKMSAKFDKEQNGAYSKFVKQQIHLINSLDDDMKIDFFAALTRSFLLTELDQPLFFKLCKFISICTVDELLFLRDCPTDFRGNNSVVISSLYQYGLFIQSIEKATNKTYYVLSDFAYALKQNCLNFEDGLQGISRIENYGQMRPLSIPEAASFEDLNKLLN